MNSLRRGFALLSLCFCGSSFALPAADVDFWHWLGPQFRLESIQHPSIDAWEKRYRRRHLELEVILDQGKEYLYPLALAVRDRGMPLEIALLPVVESHLDPSAVSRSGARGLWQLLPSTAAHLGLEKNWWRDDSADFSLSTDAALNYLDYLHDRFGGWLLGLAAYNAGEGRVYGQMRERRRRGKATDYWDLELLSETRNYVPKLLALARIVRDPGIIRLPQVTTKRHFTRVNTQGPLDISQIAELANLSIEKIYRYNPQLLRWCTPPDGPHSVYMPLHNSRIFNKALQQFPDERRRRWSRHTVHPGETLSDIAKRKASSVTLLKKLNGLSNDRLQSGQRVIVADHQRGLSRLTISAAARQTRLSYAERSLPAGLHEVQPGESLWSIARYYRTTVGKLLQRNQLRSASNLFPGQILDVGSSNGPRRIFYEVRPGDMLSLIAERYSISVRDIRSWNGIDGSLLHPGQTLELRLPPSTG